jgi:hypothetical protein
LNEYVYAAELAGLGYSLANTKCGITLSIKVRGRTCRCNNLAGEGVGGGLHVLQVSA